MSRTQCAETFQLQLNSLQFFVLELRDSAGQTDGQTDSRNTLHNELLYEDVIIQNTEI